MCLALKPSLATYITMSLGMETRESSSRIGEVKWKNGSSDLIYLRTRLPTLPFPLLLLCSTYTTMHILYENRFRDSMSERACSPLTYDPWHAYSCDGRTRDRILPSRSLGRSRHRRCRFFARCGNCVAQCRYV